MQTRYILLISGIISVVFSALASVIPIWAFNQAQVSSFFPTLFTPATITFSIWSIIYLSWLILWWLSALGQIEIKKENIILLSCAQILSSLWLIPSQNLWIGTSLLVMFWVLYFLSILFYESRDESPAFKIVSDLFFGWIIVACIANIHLMLVSYDIYFFPLDLTIISIITGLLLNVYFILKYNSIVPSIVLIWALMWIILWQDAISIQIVCTISILFIWALLAYTHISVKK